MLGAEIDVPTLDGEEKSVKYTIPEGTQYGTRFVLKQKGVPFVNNKDKRGDLYFTVIVEIPKGLTDKQREKMEEFAEACGKSNYSKKNSFFKKKK